MYNHTSIGERRVSLCLRRQSYPSTRYEIHRDPSCNRDIVSGKACLDYAYAMDKEMHNTGTLTLELATAESCIYQKKRNEWIFLNKTS